MIFLTVKNLALIFALFIVLTCSNLRSQTEQDSLAAIQFFIDGKTEEINGNSKGALEDYKTALKYYNSPGIHYAISNIYSQQNKWQDALIEINYALQLAPDETSYLEHRARIYYTMDNVSKAAELYEKILSIDSNYSYGLYNLARIYEELKQPSKAIVIYEKLTDEVGFDMEILRRMYEIYNNNKDYEKCLEVMEYALKLDPYNPTYIQQLGALYERLGKNEQAQEIFERYYLLNPDDKTIQSELAKIYFKGNEIEKGFQNFSKLLAKENLTFVEKVQIGELYYNSISEDKTAAEVAKNIFTYLNESYPTEWIPYYYLGELDISNSDVPSGIQKFQKALELADTSKEAFQLIGFSYYRINKNDEAYNILSKGIALYPEDFRLNYFYGISLQRKGMEEEGVKYLEKALSISPDDISVLTTLAMAYNGLKRFDESDAMYERALKLDPNSALVLNNYAYNLTERGINLNKALDMAKTAVDKEPNSASYLDTYGWVFYKMGRYDEALKYISKAVSISGSSAVLLEHLGDIYYAMKDLQNAKKYWEKSIDINPNNQNVREKLKLI